MLLYHSDYAFDNKRTELDDYLFSGFMSAINVMAETEFNQKGVDSILMGDYKFFYEHFCGIIFAVAADPVDSDTLLKNLLKKIREGFFRQFEEVPWLNFIEEIIKAGQSDQFQSFDPTLKEIIHKFNAIRIEKLQQKHLFLELYNSLINTFIEKVSAFSKLLNVDFTVHISKDIKRLVVNCEEMNNLEIQPMKINFEFINLEKIEIDELKTYLHEIFVSVVNAGYDVVGDKPLNRIIPHLYPIIARKLPEIQQMGISFPLLQALINFYYFHNY